MRRVIVSLRSRDLWLLVAGLSFRYACHAAMLLMALLAERRPAPSLPDAVLSVVPYLPSVDRWNFLIWLACYLPPALALALVDFKRFLRFLAAGGLLSLLRGLCILATGLGPVHGQDVNAGMSLSAVFATWFQLLNPLASLIGQAAQVHLTKDLFFSGHTATTFLVVLYAWRHPRLRWWAVAGHLLVVATVFFSHLHYTIDVLGAYAFTLAVYAIFEWRPRRPAGHPACV